MKAKTRVQHTGMKSQAMAIVVLMIIVLSAFFLYNIIRYNKKEIEDITITYDKLIKRSFNVSQIHMAYPYRAAIKEFLAMEVLKDALAAKEQTTLSQLTLSFFNSLGKRLSSSLEKMNWYSADGSLVMEITPAKQMETIPATSNPLVSRSISSKSEYEEFFITTKGLYFRQIIPVVFKPNASASGAFEVIMQSEDILETIDLVLGLNLTLIRTGDEANPDKTRLAANPLWKKIKGGYYMKSERAAAELEPVLDRLDATNLKMEIAFDKKIYFVYPHIDVADSDGNLMAKIISLQDITQARGKINHSIFLIIVITAVILLLVFFILYFSFGRLMGRLQEREKQLEFINRELESEIKERMEIEAELTTHRDHLEDMIAEGTRELQIKSQEIESNEKKLRTITSSIQDALIMLDYYGNILFRNPAAERMFGYTPDELQGKDFFQHIVPVHDYKKIAAALEQLRKTKTDRAESPGHGQIIEIECKRDNGKLFPAELMLSLVEIQDKPHLISLVRDITQKKAEETEKRILLRSVEQSSVAIEITDTDGIIQYVNPKFTEITGYEREEIIGKNARILKSDFNPDEIYRDLWTTITSGKDWHGELYNMKKSGALYWDSTLISPIKDAEGNITHFVAIKEDITERKNIEDELRDAKESAEAASRSKGEFLANMSHEIRTPLNSIIGMTEFTLETQLTQEQHNYLRVVKNASNSLLFLVNDILDFSKMESRSLTLEEIEFDLWNAIEYAVDNFALKVSQKGLDLTCHIKPDVPSFAKGDPSRLRQIIVNLVGNAVKFTENGEVSLLCEKETENKEQNSMTLHFAVSDSGIGIPQDKLESIFDVFSQVDTSTTRQYGGTGLGLTIAKQLVGLMGGKIRVESEVGKGSTFHFTIELRNASARKIKTRSADIASLAEQCLHFLVADSNPSNRVILRDILSSWGFKHHEVASGNEVIAAMDNAAQNNNPYHMVIVDSQLTDMDGFGISRRIKENPQYKNVKIIMLTSIGHIGDAARAMEAGISAYLLKPLKRSDLFDAIINLQKPSRTSETTPKPELITAHSIREERQRQKPMILLAEDNPSNRDLFTAMLKKAGYHVIAVEDGAKVLDIYEKHPFDMILMDVQMPIMDGLQVTRFIREKEKSGGTHIPIMAMTGQAGGDDRLECLGAGMDDHIPKPFTFKELTEKVNHIIKHSGSPQDASGNQTPLNPDQTKPLNVLVAEDNKENQEVAAILLKKLEVEFEFAENGKIALDKLNEKKFDLLLLDMQMPTMDGMQTIKHIRNNEKLKDLYVISITAHAIKGDAEKYINAGCNDYLPKPINKEQFRKKINDLIELKKKLKKRS